MKQFKFINSTLYILASLFFLTLINSNCTRVYLLNNGDGNDIKVINHLKDFNPEKQSLYINFINPETKQIVVLNLNQKSPKDTIIFSGNISDFNKTFSHDFVLKIPVKYLMELEGRRISSSSFSIDSSSSIIDNDSFFFSTHLPILLFDVDNYYSEDGIIQTMRGKVSSPNIKQVDFYAISDFVPLIVWGGVLIAGSAITYITKKTFEGCRDKNFIIEHIEKCKKNQQQYKVTKENGECNCECIPFPK